MGKSYGSGPYEFYKTSESSDEESRSIEETPRYYFPTNPVNEKIQDQKNDESKEDTSKYVILSEYPFFKKIDPKSEID